MKAVGIGSMAMLLSSAVGSCGWSASLQRLPYPRENSPRYPLDAGRCGEDKKVLPPPGNRSLCVLPVSCRHTDWVIGLRQRGIRNRSRQTHLTSIKKYRQLYYDTKLGIITAILTLFGRNVFCRACSHYHMMSVAGMVKVGSTDRQLWNLPKITCDDSP
jgi:hypothetical protein